MKANDHSCRCIAPVVERAKRLVPAGKARLTNLTQPGQLALHITRLSGGLRVVWRAEEPDRPGR